MSLLQKARQGRGLPGFALFVVCFMVLVILEGAVVRATGSGNGCGNHWPLCNGEVLPHHPRLATIIEFTHRSLTGACTTLVAALIAWTFLARGKGDRARRAAVWTGILLLTEGALGAVLVKGGYVERNASNARVAVQCVHFSNTMLLLAAMALTWWRLRTERTVVMPTGETRSLTIVALVATMVAGATGSVAALADTLFPSPSLSAALAQDFAANAPLIIRTRWIHPATACLNILCVLLLSRRLRSNTMRALVWITVGQVVLGGLDVVLLAPLSLQVLHLLGADLFWIALVAASEEALQHRPRTFVPTTSVAEPLTAR